MRKRALIILAILGGVYLYMHPLPILFGHIAKKLGIWMYHPSPQYIEPVTALWINGFALLILFTCVLMLLGFISWFIIHGGE